MNNNVISSRVQMESIVLQNLVAEVKETIATGIVMNENAKSATFKSIDFWNIQRKGRFVNSSSKRKKSTSISLSHISF